MTPKATLKAYFETGDKPTQAQFADLIETLYPKYTKWVGTITQSGTDAPEAVVLENTTGATITFTREAAGNYKILCPGLIPTPESAEKVGIFQNLQGAVTLSGPGTWLSVSKTFIGVNNIDEILMSSYYEGSAPADGLLTNGFQLELRFYF